MSAERRRREVQVAGVGPRDKLRQVGWEGWDEYAPFYDWENAQTLGRRDVPFWQRLALTARGRVLELGCGTGRVSKPLVKAGVDLIGIDRSAEMLRRINPQSIRPSTLREPQGRPEQRRGTTRSGQGRRVAA